MKIENVIDNAKLAELSVNATLLQIAPGGVFEGKASVEDCTSQLHGQTSDQFVDFVRHAFAPSVVAGTSTISEFLKRDGIEFEGGITNHDRLKTELIKMWDNFAGLPKETQEAHTTALLAWVAGEGKYPKLP